MPYIRDSFWRGREWVSVDDMQAGALRWCREVAGRRGHRGLDGAQPLAVFEAVEAAVLRPLPRSRFELASWSSPKVGPDCHVKVAKTLYSVPWKHIGARVDARLGERTLRVFLDGQLIKTHPRVESGRRTDHDDYPPDKIAFLMRTPVWCRSRARELGPSVTAVVGELLAVDVLHRLRSAQGVIGLADKYPAARVDAACAKALAAGDPAYRTVKGILAVGADLVAVDDQPGAGATAPAHLHGPATLLDGLDGGVAGAAS